MIYSKNRGLARRSTAEGITLLIAIIITASLLLISTGMVNLALRQAFLTSSSRESQFAFYAADTGIECALYWDVRNPSYSAFATSTMSTIHCNEDATNQNPTNPAPAIVGGESAPSFTIKFLPDPYCAVVTVTKFNNGTTQIESKGYNTCDTTNPDRVERAVKVMY